MKTALVRWLARHARSLALALLVTAAVIIALAAPLFLCGCASPERTPPPISQAPLAAQAPFLDGALLVKVTLEPAAGGNARGPGGRPAGGGGHRPPPGPGGSGGGPAGGREEDAGASFAAPAPVTARLHVAVTNQGTDTLTFAITDVISELGNFAIRPERLSLAPHQTAEIDPLGSTYPAAITELSVEVRLRHHGATESHLLRLAAEPAVP